MSMKDKIAMWNNMAQSEKPYVPYIKKPAILKAKT